MLRTQLAAATLALAALAASGCGSSKSGATTTSAAATTATTTSAEPTTTTPSVTVTNGKSLSLAHWVAAGDAICQRVQNQLATISAHNPTQFERGLPQAAIIYTNEAEDLGKLAPPKTSVHDWETYINDVHLYSEYTNTILQEFKAGHKTISPALQAKLAALQSSEITIGKRYGFKVCSIGE